MAVLFPKESFFYIWKSVFQRSLVHGCRHLRKCRGTLTARLLLLWLLSHYIQFLILHKSICRQFFEVIIWSKIRSEVLTEFNGINRIIESKYLNWNQSENFFAKLAKKARNEVHWNQLREYLIESNLNKNLENAFLASKSIKSKNQI